MSRRQQSLAIEVATRRIAVYEPARAMADPDAEPSNVV